MNLNIAAFREVGLDDRDPIQSRLFRVGSRSCEQNFCNMFNWGPMYQYRWQLWNDRLLVHLAAENALLFPIGEILSPLQLAALSDQLFEQGLGSTIFDVPPEYLQSWPDYERYFTAVTTEDSWDYIYAAARLDELDGPKLRKKRNHIAQFERAYPNWYLIPLTGDTVRDYERFVDSYYADLPGEQRLADDYPALKTALEFFCYTGIEGLALHTGNAIAAIALFSRQNHDTYTIHFEKTDKAISGASQMINRQTAVHLRSRCCYLNREQDLGIPGLRHAKRSYDPDLMLQNYTLERKGISD